MTYVISIFCALSSSPRLRSTSKTNAQGIKRTFPEQEKPGAGLAEIRPAFRSDLAESLT